MAPYKSNNLYSLHLSIQLQRAVDACCLLVFFLKTLYDACCCCLQGLGKGWPTIRLELPLVIDATFCAGAGMIAFGAVLGKTTPTQLTWLMVGMVSLL